MLWAKMGCECIPMENVWLHIDHVTSQLPQIHTQSQWHTASTAHYSLCICRPALNTHKHTHSLTHKLTCCTQHTYNRIHTLVALSLSLSFSKHSLTWLSTLCGDNKTVNTNSETAVARERREAPPYLPLLVMVASSRAFHLAEKEKWCK